MAVSMEDDPVAYIEFGGLRVYPPLAYEWLKPQPRWEGELERVRVVRQSQLKESQDGSLP